VRGVLLQAFNTKSTKDHGAARSDSDDESAQAVLQQSGMEIEKQADAQAAHAEIGQDLRVVCRHKLGNRFDFNDHLVIDENVGAEAFVELDALVCDRNSDLPLKGDSSLRQLMTQAALVYGFQHTRTGGPMHLYGEANDLLGQFTRKQHTALPPCRFVVLRDLRVKSLTLRNREP
jgi:hypothetical protein